MLSTLPVMQSLEENIGLTWLFKLRDVQHPPEEIVVVAMDKTSADNFNIEHAPGLWPRSLHRQLIEKLNDYGVKVIVFDVFFREQRTNLQDQALAQTIERAENVILVEILKKEAIETDRLAGSVPEILIEKIVQPIPVLSQAAVALAPFPLPRVPVKVSQFWKFAPDAGDAPTLPVVAYQFYTLDLYPEFLALLKAVSPESVSLLPQNKDMIIADKRLEYLMSTLRQQFISEPDLADKLLKLLENRTDSYSLRDKRLLTSLIKLYGGGDSQYLNFYGPARTLRTIPYYQLLQTNRNAMDIENIPDLNNKVVFVGSSESYQWEQIDGFYSVYSHQETGLDISGVEIAATAFANLYEDLSVSPLTIRKNFLVLLVWCLLLGLLCYLFSASMAIGAVIIVAASYFWFAIYQFRESGVWLPLVMPLLMQAPFILFVGIFWKYMDSRREQKEIRRAFGYYLPEREVDRLVKEKTHFGVGGQLKYGICLSTDAEQYTALSEKMSPESLSALMNQYYEVIFNPVKSNDGFVSDVVGDAMLAIWASASMNNDLKNRAANAALDIIKAVEHFNETQAEHKLYTRLGIHCGEMVLGNIGALNHFEYRAVGDMVNTATRIEGLNKLLGTRMLVSGDIHTGLNGLVTRKLGKFILAGKTKPVSIYELLGRRDEVEQNQLQLCDDFGKSLNIFYQRQWEESACCFRDIIENNNGDPPSQFYLDLCKHYQRTPPAADWKGNLVMKK